MNVSHNFLLLKRYYIYTWYTRINTNQKAVQQRQSKGTRGMMSDFPVDDYLWREMEKVLTTLC